MGSKDNVEIVKFLIDNGAQISVLDNEKRTPLMLGAKLGNVKCVELLLSHSCDIDQVDSHGNTALHYGCEGSGEGGCSGAGEGKSSVRGIGNV